MQVTQYIQESPLSVCTDNLDQLFPPFVSDQIKNLSDYINTFGLFFVSVVCEVLLFFLFFSTY